MRKIIKLILLSLTLLILSKSYGQFITRDGEKLMLDNEEILLKGMSFGNLVWIDREIPSIHHDARDFRRLNELGMNAIRFYMNYKTFEDDSNPYIYKQSGWEWIDQNVEWAKAHGIYLILNMHIPHGGFQSQCEGEALWEDIENQNRLVALWAAIAERYKDEPQIAAYDLVNEPTPKDSVEQWFNLAERLVNGIRTVDNNHLIVAERAIAVNCDYGFNDGNFNYPPLTEENLMYTVHMYEPFEFTHQQFDWANLGEGGSYPDESRFSFPSDLEWVTGQFTNPTLASGTNDWTYIEGNPFQVTDEELIVARPVFLAHNLGDGLAFYDDIQILEVDVDGNTITEIATSRLDGSETTWVWAKNNDVVFKNSTDGHNDNFSYTATGTSDFSTITIASLSFPVVQGKYYQINGWVKGENIPAGATVTWSTEFFKSTSGNLVTKRNKQALTNQILDYSKYIEDLGYPVYFGEFGAGRPTFEDNRGGERWVEDVIDIFDSLGYHWTYHAYRESSFGYYATWDTELDTTTVNVLLREVFIDNLNTEQITGVNEAKELFMEDIAYPNPFTNTIKVENKKFEKIAITDLKGKLIVKSSKATINTDALEKGTYLLILLDEKDQILGLKKMIKQ